MPYNPKSRENLKLGAEARRTGKERHAYSVMPSTHAWLASGGNASLRLDEVVEKLLNGELVPISRVQNLELQLMRLRERLAKVSPK